MLHVQRPGVKALFSGWAIFVVLFVAAMVAYAPALGGEFLWDDSYLVGQNPFFKSPIFLLEIFKHHLFLDSFSIYYRPLQNVSYMVDYWLWNRDAFGYHLSNVCFHALSSLLLFLLLKRLIPTLVNKEEFGGDNPSQTSNLAALLVSLIWVVHPIHNAAVAYVAGRADSLACIFAISAWLLYLRADRGAIPFRMGLRLVSGICFLMALCSKEIAFIWMVVFLFHTMAFNRTKTLRDKIGTVAGIVFVLGCYLILRSLPRGGSPLAGDEFHSVAVRLVLILRALGDYTWLIFYPKDLHMDRVVLTPDTYASLASWQAGIRSEYLSVIGVLTVASFVYMGISKLPGRRLRLFSVGWFVIGFLPISNLFPLNAQVAEHWIYMPSMGYLLFLAGCVLGLPQRVRAIAAGVAALCLIPLAMRTHERSWDWADTERFYLQTIADGGGTTRINLNLALLYQGRGDKEKAERMLRNIVKRFPDYVPARLNLGVNLREQGKMKEAEQYFVFDKASSAKLAGQYSHTWTAARSLAQARFSEKKYEESLALLDEAIIRYPEVWELLQTKAGELLEIGRTHEALEIVQKYCDAHWWHYEAFMMLARLQIANGENEAAIKAFRHAALLDIHAGDPFTRIAHVYLGLDRGTEAYQEQIKAVQRDSGTPSQYIFLSAILDKLNRKEESEAAMKHAKELIRSVNGSNNHT